MSEFKQRARTSNRVLGEVLAERIVQHDKWGEQNHANGTGPWQPLIPYGHDYATIAQNAKRTTDAHAKGPETLTYADIFLEEVFEAMAEHDPEKLRTELIQCAAVAVAWVEKIDRDTAKESGA